MITLYDYLPSQNAYKVRLLFSHLGMQYETHPVSIFEGAGRAPAFLEISPMGAVPAVTLDDGRTLAESNAILTYFANGTRYLPSDRFTSAKVAQWLSFEGDYVQAGIATLRHWVQTGKASRRTPDILQAKRDLSLRTLAALDGALDTGMFLAGEDYTIADMSVFAYVHRADEADLPLDNYGNVVAWIDRVQAQQGFLAKTYPYSIDPHSAGEL